MAQEIAAQLRARIEELETENETLKDESKGLPPTAKKRAWGWTVLATTLITIGALLSPVAVVGSWIQLTLTDTDRFVAAYAPLANDPAVQAFVATQAVDAINQAVDVPALTSNVIDGIIDLGTGPVATKALDTLKGPAARGIQGLIESSVDKFVQSDAFRAVWTQSLRISHTQLVKSMHGNTDGAVVVSDTGVIGIQLGPILDRIKTALVDQGLTFASAIPSVNRTIVIAQSDAIPKVQLAYNAAVAGGYWLPFIALGSLLAGILVARRRSVALIWAAVALALAMAITLVGLGAGNLLFISAVTPIVMPVGVATVIFNAVAGAMQALALGVLVIAVVVAIVAWLAGPFDRTRKLRALAQSGAASIREAAEKRGVSTGRFGKWLYSQRLLLRIAVSFIAAAIVLFARPLSASLIIWTVILGAVMVALLEVLQRDVVTVPPPAEPESA
jgi:hypothetical protein